MRKAPNAIIPVNSAMICLLMLFRDAQPSFVGSVPHALDAILPTGVDAGGAAAKKLISVEIRIHNTYIFRH